MKLFDWLKQNKLAAFLGLIVFYLLFKNQTIGLPFSRIFNQTSQYDMTLPMAEDSVGMAQKSFSLPVSGGGSTPRPEVAERLVVEQSSLSLLVDNVREKVDQLIEHVETKGGYMVSSSLTQPGEAPFATVVVRVPSEELRPALEYFRSLAIKVTSENLIGWDVTDEYVDLEAKLETLNKTKTKFEEILDKATKVEDILRVQREIINLQTQIDNLKGRQEYLKKTAENAKLTVYLSTDEWALPYMPEEPVFRPRVIFKQAVRSLVKVWRGIVKGAIWLGVYSFILVPVLLILYWRRKRKP